MSYAQVINGIVLDSKTDSAICFASVGFNGTFVGTNTDMKGHFTLDISKNRFMPLSVCAIGYNSLMVTEYVAGKTVVVHLAPKLFELREVVVNAESLIRKRKKYMEIFRDEFLGTSSNASNCFILNESDITFNYGSDKDTLKAFALKPLQIDNRSLGYHITYYLDKFEYYKKNRSFSFKGSVIFREDTTTNQKKIRQFEKRRESTYLGSIMQFFRVLWINDCNTAGFTVRNSEGESLNYNDIVVRDGVVKFLKYPGSINIYYTDFRYTYVSTLRFLKEQVYFDRDGYCDKSGIYWEKAMARQRTGDLLPYEYEFK